MRQRWAAEEEAETGRGSRVEGCSGKGGGRLGA
jgi:hypothetical protein